MTRHDQQTYERARNAAILGLAVELVLLLTFALLALHTDSPALTAAAWYLLGGVPIWCVLALIYHQHVLERMEALDSEQLAHTDSRAAALFDRHAEELRVARRRLSSLYKWGLGLVAAFGSLFLLGCGALLMRSILTLARQGALVRDALDLQTNTTALIVATTVGAFLAFITARYISGMTDAAEWRLLRAGAGYLISNAIVASLALAAGVFAHYGNATGLAALGVLIPALMIAVGLEILLSLLLSAYRPRRPGEAPRPAIDSRLLGWLASPGSITQAVAETLRYQFGVEVSRSWFYQLLSRAVWPLVLFGCIALIALSSLVIVAPHERAVVTRAGKIISNEPAGADRSLQPGPHLKTPWPLGRAHKHPVGRVHHVVVGSVETLHEADAAMLWTHRHAESEEYLITAPTPYGQRTDERGSAAASQAASGMALVGAQLVIQYRVAELERYLHGAEDPVAVLTALAERRANAYFLERDIDTLLGSGRTAIGGELLKQINADAQQADLGLEVVFVGLTAIHPPSEGGVATAFLERIDSVQEKHSTIEQARQEANEARASVAGSSEQAALITEALDELTRLNEARRVSADPSDREQLAQQARDLESRIEAMIVGARGEAARIIMASQAERWSRALSERAKAERFDAESLAASHAPRYYKAKRYLEVLADGMINARKYVIAVDNTAPPVFRIDFKDTGSALETIFEPNP